jgi:hypothetical protein
MCELNITYRVTQEGRMWKKNYEKHWGLSLDKIKLYFRTNSSQSSVQNCIFSTLNLGGLKILTLKNVQKILQLKGSLKPDKRKIFPKYLAVFEKADYCKLCRIAWHSCIVCCCIRIYFVCAAFRTAHVLGSSTKAFPRAENFIKNTVATSGCALVNFRAKNYSLNHIVISAYWS